MNPIAHNSPSASEQMLNTMISDCEPPSLKRCVSPESERCKTTWENVEELTVAGEDDEIICSDGDHELWEDRVEDELMKLEDTFADSDEAALVRQGCLRSNLNNERRCHLARQKKKELEDSKWEQSVLNVLLLLVRFQVQQSPSRKDLQLIRRVHKFHQDHCDKRAIPVSHILKVLKNVASFRHCPPRFVLVPTEHTTESPTKRRRLLPFNLSAIKSKRAEEAKSLSKRFHDLSQKKRQERCALMLENPDDSRVGQLKEDSERIEDLANVLNVWSSFLSKQFFISRKRATCEEQMLLVQEMMELASEDPNDVDSLVFGLLQYITLAEDSSCSYSC